MRAKTDILTVTMDVRPSCSCITSRDWARCTIRARNRRRTLIGVVLSGMLVRSITLIGCAGTGLGAVDTSCCTGLAEGIEECKLFGAADVDAKDDCSAGVDSVLGAYVALVWHE